jgi:hypothetical protein
MPPLMNFVVRRRAGPGRAAGDAVVRQRPMTRTGAASRHGSGPWTRISLPGGRPPSLRPDPEGYTTYRAWPAIAWGARPAAAAPMARCRRRRRRRSCRRQQQQPGPGPGLLRVVDASRTDVRPTTAQRLQGSIPSPPPSPPPEPSHRRPLTGPHRQRHPSSAEGGLLPRHGGRPHQGAAGPPARQPASLPVPRKRAQRPAVTAPRGRRLGQLASIEGVAVDPARLSRPAKKNRQS